MNLILLEASDFVSDRKVRLSDRRGNHIRTVHRAGVGDQLRVGRVNGGLGLARVSALNERFVELELEPGAEFEFHRGWTPAPEPLPLTLYLALPRPKFLKRVLQTATTLGVKRIFLFNSYRVEKIYWSCQQLQESGMRAACLLGLEQARDTILPEIRLKRLFRPFVEDELPLLSQNTHRLVAHPGADRICPRAVEGPASLVVGPEGGFIDFELEKFKEAGFELVRTFPRILKVETAVASLIGRLF